ncbi:MAG: hypothetical protein AB8B97_04220 [Granulosicoccus sp.]
MLDKSDVFKKIKHAHEQRKIPTILSAKGVAKFIDAARGMCLIFRLLDRANFPKALVSVNSSSYTPTEHV